MKTYKKGQFSTSCKAAALVVVQKWNNKDGILIIKSYLEYAHGSPES